jgi:peptidyl-prolyl cis-trans isomerase B (cyclophilin B)
MVDIKVILYDQTPKHKANFLKLAENGDYDSTTFHRILENFMIQGGDVNAKPSNENKIDYRITCRVCGYVVSSQGRISCCQTTRSDLTLNKESSGSQWYIVQGEVYDETMLTTDMQKANQCLPQLMQKPAYAGLQDELRQDILRAGAASLCR